MSGSGSDSKESACNAGDLGSIPGLGRSPGEERGNALQYFLAGELHGQRSLEGYSPRGPEESHTAEQLTLSSGLNQTFRENKKLESKYTYKLNSTREQIKTSYLGGQNQKIKLAIS